MRQALATGNHFVPPRFASPAVEDDTVWDVDEPLLPVPPLSFTKLLSSMARPLICGACSCAALISKLSIVPLLEEPSRTAAGCGSIGGGREAFGTGKIPSACNAGRDVTGSCSGIATGGGRISTGVADDPDSDCVAAEDGTEG